MRVRHGHARDTVDYEFHGVFLPSCNAAAALWQKKKPKKNSMCSLGSSARKMSRLLKGRLR